MINLKKKLDVLIHENEELRTTSTRSKSTDSRFAESSLGSAKSAGELNIKRWNEDNA